MNEVLEPDYIWILKKVKKELQRRVEMSRQIRERYFQSGEMEPFYYWNGYVGALYDILTLIKELEGGIKNESLHRSE